MCDDTDSGANMSRIRGEILFIITTLATGMALLVYIYEDTYKGYMMHPSSIGKLFYLRVARQNNNNAPVFGNLLCLFSTVEILL